MVIDELIQQNMLSDDRFVEQYMHYRSNRGFGPIKIKLELIEKGISEEVIGPYLNTVDWFELAKTAWQKKFKATLPDNLKEKMKQINFLTYRGFTQEQIKETISGSRCHDAMD